MLNTNKTIDFRGLRNKKETLGDRDRADNGVLSKHWFLYPASDFIKVSPEKICVVTTPY
jgi:hypothetical protein